MVTIKNMILRDTSQEVKILKKLKKQQKSISSTQIC